MNRGDRGGKVFKDWADYELFLKATAEVCERTMASHKWLTARIHMGHPQNLTAYIKRAPMIAGVSLARLMRDA